MDIFRRKMMTTSMVAAGALLVPGMTQAASSEGAPFVRTSKRLYRDRLEAALARISDPRGEGSRTFIRVYADEARLAADAADARANFGHPLSKLDGRILSIKDVFDVAGEPTTAGSVVYKNAPPAVRDAEIVRRLRDAGAIIVGKTNMTEFAFSGLGNNPHYGTPGNPFDRSRVPGGSSCGAAVAAADQMCDISIGSDTGGSVRVPSSFCGLVGFKPTQARVSRDGAVPLSLTTDTVGPLAHSVQDAAETDSVLSGDPLDRLRARSVVGMRLGVPRGRLLEGLDGAVAAAYERALSRLSKAGAILTDVDLRPIYVQIDAITAIGSFSAVEAAWFHKRVLQERPSEIDVRVVTRIRATSALTGPSYVEMLQIRLAAIRDAEVLMSPYDALVLPTVAILPPKIADLQDNDVFAKTNLQVLRNAIGFSQIDMPGMSLPLPDAGSLPIGLMLMGGRGRDRSLLEVGAGVEALHSKFS